MVPETAGGCVQPGPAQRPSPKLCLRSHCWREGRQSALTVHHLVSRCEKSELLLHAKGSQFTVGGGGGCTPAGLAQLPVACCGKWAVWPLWRLRSQSRVHIPYLLLSAGVQPSPSACRPEGSTHSPWSRSPITTFLPLHCKTMLGVLEVLTLVQASADTCKINVKLCFYSSASWSFQECLAQHGC